MNPNRPRNHDQNEALGKQAENNQSGYESLKNVPFKGENNAPEKTEEPSYEEMLELLDNMDDSIYGHRSYSNTKKGKSPLNSENDDFEKGKYEEHNNEDKEFLNDPNLRDPRPSRPRKTAEDNPKPKNRISNGISDETYKKAMDNSINILKNGRKAERSQIESYRQELIAKDKELRQKQTEFDNQTQEMLRALQQDSGTNGASPKGKKRKRFSLFKK